MNNTTEILILLLCLSPVFWVMNMELSFHIPTYIIKERLLNILCEIPILNAIVFIFLFIAVLTTISIEYFQILFRKMRYKDKKYSLEQLMNGKWFNDILKDIGFYEKTQPYPKTQYGLISFLGANNIKLIHYKNKKGWMYVGMDTKENNDFTEDLTIYETFDKCVNASIIECTCYLANKKRKK